MPTVTTQSGETLSFGSFYNKIVGSDIVKAGITAFFSAAGYAILTAAYDLLSEDDIPTWRQIAGVALAGVTAGIGALIRKYKTNAVGVPFKKDPPVIQEIKVQDKAVKE